MLLKAKLEQPLPHPEPLALHLELPVHHPTVAVQAFGTPFFGKGDFPSFLLSLDTLLSLFDELSTFAVSTSPFYYHYLV